MEKQLSSLVLEALGSSEMTALQVSTILRKDLIKVTKCIKNLCYRKRLASHSSKDGQRTYQLATIATVNGGTASDTADAAHPSALDSVTEPRAAMPPPMDLAWGSRRAAALQFLDEMPRAEIAQVEPASANARASLAPIDDDAAGVQYGLMADGRLVALEGTSLTFFTVQETSQIRALLAPGAATRRMTLTRTTGEPA